MEPEGTRVKGASENKGAASDGNVGVWDPTNFFGAATSQTHNKYAKTMRAAQSLIGAGGTDAMQGGEAGLAVPSAPWGGGGADFVVCLGQQARKQASCKASGDRGFPGGAYNFSEAFC